MDKYPITEVCPYCADDVILTTNDYIYGRRYGKNFHCYVCVGCKASVGTHPDNVTPLGRLANERLKSLKIQCHELFDWFWKSGSMSRERAYIEMAKRLGIAENECHFGWFDEEVLIKAREMLKQWRRDFVFEKVCRTCLYRKKSKRRHKWMCGNENHKSIGKCTPQQHTCEKWKIQVFVSREAKRIAQGGQKCV